MRVSFICHRCGTELETDAAHAGTQVVCGVCQTPNTVPLPKPGAGTTLGGFRIVRQLGQGGMGEVYLARQLSLDRDVALKILPAQWTGSQPLVKRFLDEVRTASRLDHPNIVAAYEAGEDMGLYYMAMAYVNGETVDDRLHREGRLPEKEALVIAGKVAQALAYAWEEASLLHRDIKPTNIMIDQRGEVRLLDLGIAKSLQERPDAPRTRAGVPIGTPNYMSPEQAEGRPGIDFRTDQYALGATLYEMVTGWVPYEAPTLQETLRRQSAWRLPHPLRSHAALSPACVRLLEVMLARDPADRHATWGELVADIDRVWRGLPPRRAPRPGRSPFFPLREGEGEGGAGPGTRARAARRRKARRRAVTVAVLVAIAAVLLALDLWLLSHPG